MSPPTATSEDDAKLLLTIFAEFFPTMYGMASNGRGAWRSTRPPSSPNCDTMPACDCRNNGQLTRSEYR